ncbi:hypothetical protein [Bacillus sp. FJAT-22090]|uniref:hypothetical protein n=1 Tax=Bacillus sp. FJAT-22090 TaxID=1581038 RepID=UPI0011A8C992|nr:hypothetical protein [Bacillus sp. FJAT-22090]
MKNTKKVLLVVALLLVFLVGGLFAGSKIGANSSWTNEIVTLANKQISAAGFAKKEELKQRDLTDNMKQMLDPKIAEEQAELERLLEEYYRLKLEGLEDSPEFKKVESDIEKIRTNVFNRYKEELDLLFAK